MSIVAMKQLQDIMIVPANNHIMKYDYYPRTCAIKLFMAVIFAWVCANVSHCHPSLIFGGKVRS